MDGDEPGEPKYMVSAAIRKKYGRYPPWCRLNVDQVPLPFVNDMDITYEQKGAKRAVINQLGPALSQRQCTGQLCFRPAVPHEACTCTVQCKPRDAALCADGAGRLRNSHLLIRNSKTHTS